ncbi:MAG: hypothetical protein ACUVYA_02415 [Planctomycetota bacterium]
MSAKTSSVALGAFFAAAALAASGCSTTCPRRDPTGEVFPSVRGTALDGRSVSIPEDFAGEPVVLLIGYEMNTQFDLDRWLLGLAQAGVAVRTYELPTIPGLVPGMFAGSIDAGMRSGIPREDWGSVITIYGDAKAVAAFTGNQPKLPGRIVLLDGSGRVAFFHDSGFSVRALERLRETLQALGGAKS